MSSLLVLLPLEKSFNYRVLRKYCPWNEAPFISDLLQSIIYHNSRHPRTSWLCYRRTCTLRAILKTITTKRTPLIRVAQCVGIKPDLEASESVSTSTAWLINMMPHTNSMPNQMILQASVIGIALLQNQYGYGFRKFRRTRRHCQKVCLLALEPP